MTSNRDRIVGGKFKFSTMLLPALYLLSMGFADAKMEVRAFKVVMIPALAIETVCCSYDVGKHMKIQGSCEPRDHTITSCKIVRVSSDILSNSSMQQIPPSLKTNAPDSSTN